MSLKLHLSVIQGANTLLPITAKRWPTFNIISPEDSAAKFALNRSLNRPILPHLKRVLHYVPCEIPVFKNRHSQEQSEANYHADSAAQTLLKKIPVMLTLLGCIAALARGAAWSSMVYRSVTPVNPQPCKNGWTDRDGVWDVNLCGSKELGLWIRSPTEGALLRGMTSGFPARCRPAFRQASCNSRATLNFPN